MARVTVGLERHEYVAGKITLGGGGFARRTSTAG
jgi:hypothetical protein